MLQEKFITINNIKLFYLGGGQGQTILFFHAGQAKAKSYSESLELLAKKYHILAPDIPGLGASDVPKKVWDFTHYARFFDKFLDKLKINSVIAIGHSFGGGICLLLATQSSKISKHIIADSAGLPMELTPWTLVAPLFEKGAPPVYSDKGAKILNIASDVFGDYRKHFWELPRIYQISKKSLQTAYSQIRNICVPTLLLWGKHDNLLPPETARRLSNLIKNSKLEIIKGGHAWCLFKPKLFVKKIEDFIS